MKKVMGSQNSHNFVVGSLFFGCVCVLFQSLPFFRSFLSSQNGFLFLFIRAERIHSDPKKQRYCKITLITLKMKAIFEDRLVLLRCCCCCA